MTKTMVIIGAGQGLGKSLASKFGTQGYQIALVARNENHLNQIADELAQQGIQTLTYPADVADEQSLAQALTQIKRLESIDGVIYNAGLTAADDQKLTRAMLNQHYQVDVAGAYQTVQALRQRLASSKGVALFTGGVAGVQPFPGFLGLGVGKAALRNLVQSLNHDLAADGIFAGTVTIYGVIKPKTHFDPDLIADQFVEYAQARNAWEIDYQ